MITVEQATEIILSHLFQTKIAYISLENSLGHVLAKPILASRDFPPFDRVMMDGYAIRKEDFSKGQTFFPIQSTQGAGEEKHTLEPGNTIEIMTGAVLPVNANAVIRYEDTNVINGKAQIFLTQIKDWANIHAQGEDRKKGIELIAPNTVIGPAEISILATEGYHQVPILAYPKTCILSTGDELVGVEETPLPHQIRRSNLYNVQAALKGKFNLSADIFHMNDDETEIKETLGDLLTKYDCLIMSGGVSMGKFDYLPKILQELGVKQHFHKVKQRPGKPLWFGTKGKNNFVFALPGNPISTFVSTKKYIFPWIRKSLGLPHDPHINAILTTDFFFDKTLQYFLQVKLDYSSGKLLATPVKGSGSGDLANLLRADAFMELPLEKYVFKKGEVYPVMVYRF